MMPVGGSGTVALKAGSPRVTALGQVERTDHRRATGQVAGQNRSRMRFPAPAKQGHNRPRVTAKIDRPSDKGQKHAIKGACTAACSIS